MPQRPEDCIAADLFDDSTLYVTDLVPISNAATPLTVEDRIAYSAAVQDRLCPPVLQ